MTIPTHKSRDTTAMIGYGAVLMLWLSVENTNLVVVSVLGAGLSAMLLRLMVLRLYGGKTFSLWAPGMFFFGLLVGFGAVWCTVGLMVFKNAWHAHAYPDFPATIVTGITQRWLSWSLAGGLLGGAAALFRLAGR
ncbi:MAG: hypothetical protein F9K27_06075 [Anaerolineae bacterium]|nr:MAG: hypothetical protein F9K27_06075 [Anaerolineae bacterium]